MASMAVERVVGKTSEKVVGSSKKLKKSLLASKLLLKNYAKKRLSALNFIDCRL